MFFSQNIRDCFNFLSRVEKKKNLKNKENILDNDFFSPIYLQRKMYQENVALGFRQ